MPHSYEGHHQYRQQQEQQPEAYSGDGRGQSDLLHQVRQHQYDTYSQEARDQSGYTYDYHQDRQQQSGRYAEDISRDHSDRMGVRSNEMIERREASLQEDFSKLHGGEDDVVKQGGAWSMSPGQRDKERVYRDNWGQHSGRVQEEHVQRGREMDQGKGSNVVEGPTSIGSFGESLLQALRESDRGRQILEEELRKEINRMDTGGDASENSSSNVPDQQVRQSTWRGGDGWRHWQPQGRQREEEWTSRQREEARKQNEEMKRKEEARRKDEEQKRTERLKVEEQKRKKAEEERKKKIEEEKRLKEERRKEEERCRLEKERREKEEEERREKEEEERKQKEEEERRQKEAEEAFTALKEAEKQEAAKIAELFTQLEELKSARLARIDKQKEDNEKLKKMRQEHLECLTKEEEAATKQRAEFEAAIKKKDAEFLAKQDEVSMQWEELLKDAKEFEEMDMQGDGFRYDQDSEMQFDHEHTSQTEYPQGSHTQYNEDKTKPASYEQSQFISNSNQYDQSNTRDSSWYSAKEDSRNASHISNVALTSTPVHQTPSVVSKPALQVSKPGMTSPSTSSTSDEKETKSTKRVIRLKKRIVKKAGDSIIAQQDDTHGQYEGNKPPEVLSDKEESKPAVGFTGDDEGKDSNLSNRVNQMELIAASLSEFAKSVKEQHLLKAGVQEPKSSETETVGIDNDATQDSYTEEPTDEQQQFQSAPAEPETGEAEDFYIDATGTGDPFMEEGKEASKYMKEKALKETCISIPGLGMTDGGGSGGNTLGQSTTSSNSNFSPVKIKEPGNVGRAKSISSQRATIKEQSTFDQRANRESPYSKPNSDQFPRRGYSGMRRPYGSRGHPRGGAWYHPHGQGPRYPETDSAGNYLETHWH